MGVNILLKTIEDYLEAKKDWKNGYATEDVVKDTAKRFAYALNDLIDFRAKGLISEKQRISSTASLNIVEALLSANPAVNALISAPIPPITPDSNSISKWFEAYKKWYETDRRNALDDESII